MSEQTSGKNRLEIGPVEVFNHALSHHIAHWAAYIAMMATLIAIGASLSAFQGVMDRFRILGAAGVIFSAWFGAYYFIRGMDTYGSILCETVPQWYLARTHTLPHKKTILVGKAAAFVFALGDAVLVWILASSN